MPLLVGLGGVSTHCWRLVTRQTGPTVERGGPGKMIWPTRGSFGGLPMAKQACVQSYAMRGEEAPGDLEVINEGLGVAGCQR